jgi:2-polyprenyl-3-methyl-5-hydroxy-6-metoxy-1,4-benzoquinol methylase
MQEIKDKASAAYWTDVWEQSELSPALNLRSRDMHMFPQRALHKIFSQAFEGRQMKGMKLIEIGCGNSAWLPYLAKEFGFDVYGIDYTEEGCEQAEKILERENVTGTIYCTNAFTPGEDLFSVFDVVCSFGVVEHFSDTAATLEVFSKYLKPGGLMITSLPNMCGLNGWLHKVMNRELYNIHVPIDKKQLSAAVESAGLENIRTGYYVGVSLNVQLNSFQKPLRHYKIKRLISKAGAAVTLIFWWLEESIGAFPQTKWFSRGVFSVARKKR